MKILEDHLNGKPNPIEEYFFNGHTMNYVGPCRYCGYESLSILDFAFFELNFEESSSFFRKNDDLETMIGNYFKHTNVAARCKNIKCEKYPVNIMEKKNSSTIYIP
jgi:hypothetical protein